MGIVDIRGEDVVPLRIVPLLLLLLLSNKGIATLLLDELELELEQLADMQMTIVSPMAR
jgi:hypothetical protein